MPLTTSDIIDEVDGIPGFVQQQGRLGADTNKLKDAQAICILAKIGVLSDCDRKAGTLLTSSCEKVGWPQPLGKQIAIAIQEAVTRQGSDAKLPKRCSQQCFTWELFPTASQWVTMEDPSTPWSTKFAIAKTVCVSIELLLPLEKTRAHILESILMANGKSVERDREWFQLLARLADVLEPMQKLRARFPHRQMFGSPNDLPRDVYAYAYPSEPPSKRQFLELTGLPKSVRKNSAAFKQAHLPVATVGVPVMPQLTPQLASTDLMHLLGFMSAAMQHMQGGNAAAGSSGNSLPAGMITRPNANIHALTNGTLTGGGDAPAPESALPGSSLGHDQTDAADTRDDAVADTKDDHDGAAHDAVDPDPALDPDPDAAARAALTLRLNAASKASAKATAKATAKGKAKVLTKKPAGKILKRPAAAPLSLPKGFRLDLKDVLNKKQLREVPSKDAFATRAYALAGRIASQKGFSEKDVSIARRIGWAQGKAYWAQHNE